MGIYGLLPYFKSIEQEQNISHFRGKRLAIDGYSWLHKGVYKCGHSIVKNSDYTEFLKSFLARVEVLKGQGIHIVMVFDGDKLPLKDGTEEERLEKRKKKLEEADQLFASGDFSNADRKYAESVDITPTIAYHTINYVKKHYRDVEVIVSPYEADAQLAYLSKIGYVDGIITEDSDLIVFGAKCILYKLSNEHVAQVIRLEDIYKGTALDLNGWTHNKFIQLCILSGCDYLKSPKGIAIKTAHANFEKHKTLENILNHLKRKKKNPIDNDYIDRFYRAYLTFKYQTVWCPQKKRLVSLNNICGVDDLDLDAIKNYVFPQDTDTSDPDFLDTLYDKDLILKYGSKGGLEFLGPKLNQKIAEDLCSCKICPESHLPFENILFNFRDENLTIEDIKTLAYRKVPGGANIYSQASNSNTLQFPIKTLSQTTLPENAVILENQRRNHNRYKSSSRGQPASLKDLLGKKPVVHLEQISFKPSPPKVEEVTLESYYDYRTAFNTSKHAKEEIKEFMAGFRTQIRNAVIKPAITAFRKSFINKLADKSSNK